jgi:hypothetical protein
MRSLAWKLLTCCRASLYRLSLPDFRATCFRENSEANLELAVDLSVT